MSLTGLDLVVVGLFVAAILALGFSARLRENSVLQFLTAGRGLTLPAFVATLVSTWYGGILGIGEAASYYGAGTWLLLGVPYYVFALVYAFVFAPKVRAAEQISIPERLDSRWGRWAGLVGGALIFLLAVPAAHVLMLGVLVQLLSGWGLAAAVVVASVVASLFLYKGGLLADVRVSLLAFVAMYVGFGTMVVYNIVNLPPAQMWGQLPAELKNWTGGGGWLMVASFFILGAWTMVDPGFHQRVASAATPRLGRTGVLVSVLFWLLFDILSITTALYALAQASPGTGLELFPRFGSAILPAGLRGLFFCGMLGTIVSAYVGYTLVAGASFGREVVARFLPSLDDRQVNSWTRAGMAVATAAAIALALSQKSVVNLWYAWGGCVVGAMLIPVAQAYLSGRAERVGSGWVVASMAIAFALSFAWLRYGMSTGNEYLNLAWVRTGSGWHVQLPPAPEGAEATLVSVGTLFPALVISASILGLGALVRGRRAHEH